jgi:hypothetical protein
MAKARKQSYGAFPSFFEIKLEEGQKKALIKDADFKSRVLAALDIITADRLKITGKFDEKNGCGVCMLQSVDYDPDVSQKIWVLRSSSLSGAFLKMLYYYVVVSDRTLPSSAIENEFGDDEELW